MEEILFENESRQSREETATYLRRIADRLENGTVTLNAGEQSVTLDVPRDVTFEVKAERETAAAGEPGELGLELELEWDEAGDDGGGDLSVE